MIWSSCTCHFIIPFCYSILLSHCCQYMNHIKMAGHAISHYACDVEFYVFALPYHSHHHNQSTTSQLAKLEILSPNLMYKQNLPHFSTCTNNVKRQLLSEFSKSHNVCKTKQFFVLIYFYLFFMCVDVVMRNLLKKKHSKQNLSYFM